MHRMPMKHDFPQGLLQFFNKPHEKQTQQCDQICKGLLMMTEMWNTWNKWPEM